MANKQLQQRQKELETKLLKYSAQLRELYQKETLENYKNKCDDIMRKYNQVSKELSIINKELGIENNNS